MQFENSFNVPLPPDEAWKVLLDVPRIAPCLPGAELTETLGPDKYKGRAGVKVGPVHLFFAGEAEIVNKDEAAHTAEVRGKGNDTKGRGQANATVKFALTPDGEGTRVDVVTDLNMTGAVAQYGRASGLMKEIAGAILGKFSENLRNEIANSGEQKAPDTSAAPSTHVPSIAAAAGGHTGSPAVPETAAATAQSPATTKPLGSAVKPTAAAVPISSFSILWIALKSWLAGLFGLKKDR